MDFWEPVLTTSTSQPKTCFFPVHRVLSLALWYFLLFTGKKWYTFRISYSHDYRKRYKMHSDIGLKSIDSQQLLPIHFQNCNNFMIKISVCKHKGHQINELNYLLKYQLKCKVAWLTLLQCSANTRTTTWKSLKQLRLCKRCFLDTKDGKSPPICHQNIWIIIFFNTSSEEYVLTQFIVRIFLNLSIWRSIGHNTP